MDKTFTTPYGTFTLNQDSNIKIVSVFERGTNIPGAMVEELRPHIKKDSVVLDVGAHVGTMTVPFANMAQTVYAFEPMAENVEYLKRNIEQNHVANVEVFSVALGAKEGTVGMDIRGGNISSATIEGHGNIPVKTLDSYHFKRVDFIKIDVEGYEPEVLAGAQELINTQKPIVFFEVNLPELRKHGKNPLKKIEKMLSGYVFYHNNKKVSRLWRLALHLEPKFFFFNRGGITFDILALPKM